MSIAYKQLVRELETREKFSQEKNDKELSNILMHRAKLYNAIESLDNYQDLMDENANYKTTGNLYSVKGLIFFNQSIQSLARVYEKSKERYITSNLGMLMEQIKFKSYDDFMDRFQEAAIYFQKSFNTYEEDRVKFITYAYNSIKFGILNSYKKDNNINVSDGVRYTINRIKELRKKLAPQNVTLADIKEYYPDFSYKEIELALSHEKPMRSLNDMINNDVNNREEMIDTIVDENYTDIDKEIDDELLTRKVKEVITNDKHFSNRDTKILHMRFGIELPDDYTLQEVGQQFSITRERVRQLEKKALGLLKNKYSIELKEFY